MDKKIYNLLPQEVKDILFQSEGWLVGGSAGRLLSGESPRDFDILIQDRNLFQKTISSNKSSFTRFTSFGGVNLKLGELSIDIWCQPLDEFIIKSPSTGIMFNLRSNKTLKST